ncbi:DNA ligase [Photobacterium iliopiscarium]|uniref:DNA ligase n=1 Tax=Photobacterium iliopiscarium TaxID=56192 RepID=A0A0D8P3M3_9GAMM|nr:zinc ribbon domain-containing protein [Photobacterium iliopiscarium]KJG12482.1 DNA ligase [Photobacterium iliopiscarium]KJG22136.1 DNA ligase [Photobacterium iliopiscarium]MCD9467521.1 DNA ligase [Photobacterium iliopiscarium]MCD9488020.1 DNA ligase [Photobacterium iliopiscarium]MCF2244001.1 DNA ligase [Photobacterium iliopiscarium]
MIKNTCPQCESELSWKDQKYFCDYCQQAVTKTAFCPDCSEQLEKLQACGSASYFCNYCNELKSKSRVKIVFNKVTD